MCILGEKSQGSVCTWSEVETLFQLSKWLACIPVPRLRSQDNHMVRKTTPGLPHFSMYLQKIASLAITGGCFLNLKGSNAMNDTSLYLWPLAGPGSEQSFRGRAVWLPLIP